MAKNAVFLLLAILLSLRFLFWNEKSFSKGDKVKITTVLSSEPEILDNSQFLKVGRFKILTGRYPEYDFGQKLTIKGEIKQADKAGYFLSYPQIELISEKKGQNPAINLRQKLRHVFNSVFPRPFDGIVSGIVLGDKKLISFSFYEKLKQTGTLHIMVASGMNIAMVSEGCLSFLTLFFKRKKAILFLFILIWFYSIMSGFNPPIVRAAVMATLVYFGQIIGRKTSSGRVLFLTAGLMLFFEPFLLWDIGFQLSFLATAGLVFVQPCLKSSGFFLFKNSNFSSTIAAQITTLPVLISSFGQLNLASPFVNLLILWPIPFILEAGFVIGLTGLLWTNLAIIPSYLIFPLLFYIEQIINASASIKFFQVQFTVFQPWLFWGYYIILLSLLLKAKRKSVFKTNAF
ncbi:ComEC/Rec2 family competence protein [Candidatus Microgenomates bacterium]|jgi:competence protein ComEC|nr:MAG: ComEC/Rec2 family competence protein [Candidatus Microgenomates bacterium]